MTAPKHFLDLDKLDAATLRDILDRGTALRPGGARAGEKPLAGKTLACIFEKPSTRTRVSFDVGMKQLGGDVVVMTPAETQLGRGETIADTARVLSRYVDAIMIRTTAEQKLLELAEYATVPVINGLTDRTHPCQLMADVMTYEQHRGPIKGKTVALLELAEYATVPVINGLTDRTHPCQLMADVMTYEQHRGPIKGKTVAWAGDGNNMATSWIHAAVRFDFTLKIACPAELAPPQDVVDWALKQGADIRVSHDARDACAGADCIVTDVWVSMGDKDAPSRHNLLAPFQVTEELMAIAKPDAIFQHCLPAHRGEEVTAGVIDGPQSVVWDEAENRMHAQKGILDWCLR